MNPDLTGLLMLDNAVVNLSDRFSKPLTVAHMNLKFAGDSVLIDNLAVSTAECKHHWHPGRPPFHGASDFVRHQRRQIGPFTAPPVKSRLRAVRQAIREGHTWGRTTFCDEWTDAHASRCVALIFEHVSVARLAPLTAELFGGAVLGSIEADLRQSSPRLKTKLVMSRVDANALLSATTPVKQTLFGKLNSESTLSFSGDQASLTKTLTGTVDIRLTDGRLIRASTY